MVYTTYLWWFEGWLVYYYCFTINMYNALCLWSVYIFIHLFPRWETTHGARVRRLLEHPLSSIAPHEATYTWTSRLPRVDIQEAGAYCKYVGHCLVLRSIKPTQSFPTGWLPLHLGITTHKKEPHLLLDCKHSPETLVWSGHSGRSGISKLVTM